MPGGELVGTAGTYPHIRILPGDMSTAQKDFDYLTVGGNIDTSTTYPGIRMSLPGNTGFIGLRPTSSHDLPTIDPVVPNLPFGKIHYK